jgi:hypothetical protein
MIAILWFASAGHHPKQKAHLDCAGPPTRRLGKLRRMPDPLRIALPHLRFCHGAFGCLLGSFRRIAQAVQSGLKGQASGGEMAATIIGIGIAASSLVYWLGVYALVILAVAVPFLALYLTICILRWCFTTIRFAIRTICGLAHTDPPSHWVIHRRKPAKI